MSRDITASVAAAISSPQIEPFFAVDLDLDGASVHIWNGYGDLVIGAKTYVGAGQLVAISTVEETTEIEAKSATVTLTGIPVEFFAAALTTPFQGRALRIYFGVTSAPADYVEVFSGEIDKMDISEQSETATVQVVAESVMIRLERPVVRRFTDQDQKARYPGDKFFEFIAGLQDKQSYWGRA